MKSIRNLVSTSLLISALFAVLSIPVYTVAQTQNVPTSDELTVLLKTATTPLEHHRIAMYYSQEASRLKHDAAFHRAWVNVYGKGQGAIHCTNLAREYEQGAKDADALSTMHENMARAAETKQRKAE